VQRVMALTLAPVWIGLGAAYVFAASSTGFGPAASVAAASALAIAGAAILYAWREPAPIDR
jgi:hypothetical protein